MGNAIGRHIICKCSATGSVTDNIGTKNYKKRENNYKGIMMRRKQIQQRKFFLGRQNKFLKPQTKTPVVISQHICQLSLIQMYLELTQKKWPLQDCQQWIPTIKTMLIFIQKTSSGQRNVCWEHVIVIIFAVDLRRKLIPADLWPSRQLWRNIIITFIGINGQHSTSPGSSVGRASDL